MATFLHYSNTSVDVTEWIGDIIFINKTMNLYEHYSLTSALLGELKKKYMANVTAPTQRFLATTYTTFQKALFNITLMLSKIQIDTNIDLNKPVEKSISYVADPHTQSRHSAYRWKRGWNRQ